MSGYRTVPQAGRLIYEREGDFGNKVKEGPSSWDVHLPYNIIVRY